MLDGKDGVEPLFFSVWEKVPEGRMREGEFRPTEATMQTARACPHPALRATFSRWEKGSSAT